MLGKIEDRRRREWQKMRWMDGITDSMDMSLSKLNSGSWWWTGKHGVRRPRGCKESDTTELNRVMCYMCLVTQSHMTVCDAMGCSPPGSSVHGDSPSKNTGVGCHALLQGILLTQGSNPGLPYCRQTLYWLSHLGSPMYVGSYTSIITLSVNGLNAPSKRHRLAGWIKKNKTHIYAVYKRPTSNLWTLWDRK